MISKKFENILTLAISFIAFFFVFNAYAQESCLTVDFASSKAAKNIYSGVDPDEDNAVSSQDVNSLAALTNLSYTLVGEAFCNHDEVQASTEVGEPLKSSLMGTIDNTINLVYQNAPSVDVYAHLANEWVPGYDNSYGTFAATQSGYQALMDSGIAGIWAQMRNLSYVFFFLVMILAGFMIMFRHKIGGQTMVTLGNSLPNIIVSLILVTFSFAIAGVIIDFGGLSIVLIKDLLGLDNYVATHGIGALMGTFFNGTGALLKGVTLGGGGLLGIGTILVALTAMSGIGAIVVGGVGVVTLLFVLLIFGVVFIGAIKVLITLFKSYFSLLLSVILGPIQIASGAIPGNQNAIKDWFNSILRNTFVFPVVFFIVNLPIAIANAANIDVGFPEKLIHTNTGGTGMTLSVTGPLFIFILQVFVLYYAAQTPKYLEAVFPPNTPKAIQEGLAAAKAGLSKIPIAGGLFK